MLIDPRTQQQLPIHVRDFEMSDRGFIVANFIKHFKGLPFISGAWSSGQGLRLGDQCPPNGTSVFPVLRKSFISKRLNDIIDSILFLKGTRAFIIEDDDFESRLQASERLVGFVIVYRFDHNSKPVVVWCHTRNKLRQCGIQSAAWHALRLDPSSSIACFPFPPTVTGDNDVVSGWGNLWMMKKKMVYDPFIMVDILINDVVKRFQGASIAFSRGE